MKHTNYKLAIFDLDGTLLDTSEGILSAVQYTIRHFGFPHLADEDLSTFIGPPIQNSFAKAYGLEGQILQDIATVFRDRYKEADLLKAVPYVGIYDALLELRQCGLKLAVATYKREDYALTLLKQFGFDQYFDVMHGADHYNKLKKSDIILRCLGEAGIQDKNDAVLIGDTVNDETGAKAAEIDFIGVTYGFGFSKEAEREKSLAICFANTPSEIPQAILQA